MDRLLQLACSIRRGASEGRAREVLFGKEVRSGFNRRINRYQGRARRRASFAHRLMIRSPGAGKNSQAFRKTETATFDATTFRKEMRDQKFSESNESTRSTEKETQIERNKTGLLTEYWRCVEIMKNTIAITCREQETFHPPALSVLIVVIT